MTTEKKTKTTKPVDVVAKKAVAKTVTPAPKPVAPAPKPVAPAKKKKSFLRKLIGLGIF